MAIRNEFLWGDKFLRGKVKKKLETFCRNLDIFKVNDLLHFGHLMTDNQFLLTYGLPPKQGMLETLRGPPEWLRGLSPTNKNIPGNHLYLLNEKNEWAELQMISTKSIYKILQNKRGNRNSCADRSVKAYGGGRNF